MAEEPPTPQKRKALALSDKLAIIAEIENGTSQANISRRTSLPKSTIQSVWNRREEIKQCSSSMNLGYKKLRRCGFPTVDSALLEWLNLQRSLDLPVNGPLLQSQAMIIAESQNVTEFNPSSSWLDNWKKRHGIVFKKAPGGGEESAVDMKAAPADSIEDILSALSVGNAPKIVGNATSGLFKRESEFCFICFSNLPQAELEGGKKRSLVPTKKNKSVTVKLLLKYLLKSPNSKSPIQDKLLGKILKLNGFREDGQEKGKRKGLRRCSRLLRLCDKCEAVAGTILKLHMELEKLQMVIVNEVETVRETILRSSGWLGGSGRDPVGGLEIFEEFSRKFCSGLLSSKARKMFDTLKEFQTTVLENGTGSIHVPLVYLQKYGPLPFEEQLSQIEPTRPIAHPVKTEPSPSTEMYEETDSFLEDHFQHDNDNDDQDSNSNDPDYQMMALNKVEVVCEEGESADVPSVSPAPTKTSTTEKVKAKSEAGKLLAGAISKLRAKRKRIPSSIVGVKKATVKKPATDNPPKPKVANLKQKMPIVKRISRHYVCDSCSYRSRTTPRFEQHLREHETKEKSFNCDKCHETFSNKQYYSFHQDLHSGLHKPKCDICQAVVDNFELVDHLKTHVETVFPCPHCCQFSSSMGKLMEHINAHHYGKDMKCEICEMRFPIKRALVKHLYHVHKMVKKVKCDFEGCNKTFLHRGSLYLHKNLHIGQFTCTICCKRFTSQYVLDIHLQIHAGIEEKRFKCDQCPESFQYRETFQTHLIKIHGATKFKCETCGKEFNSSGGLQQHITLEHEGGKICPVCGKKFLNEYRLGLHMQVHSEASNFVCEECGKAFKTSASYKSHIQIHGGKKFLCPHCSKGFTKRIYLVEHIRTHTGEKPYVCDGCGKAFTQKGPLNQHTRNCNLSTLSRSWI